MSASPCPGPLLGLELAVSWSETRQGAQARQCPACAPHSSLVLIEPESTMLAAVSLRYAGEWALAAIFQPVGCLFGMVAATLLGLEGRDRITVALETGVQNYTRVQQRRAPHPPAASRTTPPL